MATPTQGESPAPRSYYDDVRLTPRKISQYMVTLLRQLFSRKENLQEPALRADHYEWTPSDLQAETIGTGPLITTTGAFKPQTAQTRPAILISRNEIQQAGRTSIGSKHHNTNSLLGTVDANCQATLGHDQLNFMISGSHTIFCVGETNANSELLGEDVWQHLLDYTPVIRQDLRLTEFRVETLGKTGKIEEWDPNWVTPVVVAYKYQHNVILRSESPILKAFNLSFPGFTDLDETS